MLLLDADDELARLDGVVDVADLHRVVSEGALEEAHRRLAADRRGDAARQPRRDQRVGATVLRHDGLVAALDAPHPAGAAEHVDEIVDLVLVEDRDLRLDGSRLGSLGDIPADLVAGQVDGAAVPHTCDDGTQLPPPSSRIPVAGRSRGRNGVNLPLRYPPGWIENSDRRGLVKYHGRPVRRTPRSPARGAGRRRPLEPRLRTRRPLPERRRRRPAAAGPWNSAAGAPERPAAGRGRSARDPAPPERTARRGWRP